MTTRTSRGSRGERGFALVAVLGVMVLLLGIGAALHSGLIAETKLRGSHVRATDGFYAAEAGINHGMGDYKTIFASYNVPSGADFNARGFVINGRNVAYQMTATAGFPKNFPLPAGSQFAGLNSIQYQYAVTSSSTYTSGDTEATIGSNFQVDYIPLFQFLAFYQDDLEILPGPSMNLTGPVHTNGTLYLNSDTSCSGSPCTGGLQIADLEPQMPTVSVTAVGNIFRGRKDQTACLGTVQVAKLVDTNHDGNLDLAAMPCSGVQSNATLAGWLGAIKSHQGKVQVPDAGILSRASGGNPGGIYWTQANLRLALELGTADSTGLYKIAVEDVNGNIDGAKTNRLQAFMGANPGRIFYNDVPLATGRNPTATCGTGGSAPALNTFCHPSSYPGTGAAVFLSAPEVYGCPQGALISGLSQYTGCTNVTNRTLSDGSVTARRGGFYNNREHAWVYMLNVNAHDLLVWNRAQTPANQLFDPNTTTNGGVVWYLTVVGPGSTGAIPSPRYGVRIFGSKDLDFPGPVADPTGITIASDQAFYLEGDYNVGNGGNRPWQPAAIMADTLNVLSSNWSGNPADNATWSSNSGLNTCRNDCQSFQTLAARPGVSTNVYAAFLAGVDWTTSGAYNGGLENYPRFQESWSGRTLFYRGSFVSLGKPTRNNGAWCGTGGSTASGCNIYNPPLRNWNYDTNFQVVENLPPLTPRVVAVQQILFTENFR